MRNRLSDPRRSVTFSFKKIDDGAAIRYFQIYSCNEIPPVMFKNLRLVYITTRDREEARSIGTALVEERLAACVNIIDGMESVYRWEGKIERGHEAILIVKTAFHRIHKLTERVKELHSYDCPAIVSLTITEQEGNEEYLRWLMKESGHPTPGD